jgi:hypothetical protein
VAISSSSILTLKKKHSKKPKNPKKSKKSKSKSKAKKGKSKSKNGKSKSKSGPKKFSRFGVDTNNSTLDPNVAKNAGVKFVVRYISQQATAPMQPSEAINWKRHGMDLVSVWQTTVSRPVDGGSAKKNFANGVADGRAAKKQMKKLGAKKAPVYFAVDSFVAPKHPEKLPADRVIRSLKDILPYFDGVRSVMGERTGAYGSYTTIKGLFDKGKIEWGWQSYAFDSNKRIDPRIHLYQYNNLPPTSFGTTQLDYDKAFQPNFGQWRTTLKA